MRQIRPALWLLIVAVALAGCSTGGGGSADSPAQATQEWMQAYAGDDMQAMIVRTCAAHPEHAQTARQLGLQGKLDISTVKFTTVSTSGDKAVVHVQGTLRLIPYGGGDARTEDVDYNLDVVREGGRWKVCPAPLPTAVPSP